jgi:hypothetical protein
MRRCRSLVTLLVLPLLVGASTNCTFIGAGVGASVDRRHASFVKLEGGVGGVDSLEDDAQVELLLRDGRKVEGRYRGLDWTLTDARLSLYESQGADIARNLALPAPGPGASLSFRAGVVSGRLFGYGPRFVVFREEPEGVPVRVFLGPVVELTDAEGRKVTGSRLREVLGAEPVPVIAGLRLEQAGQSVVFLSEDIAAVARLETPSKGKAIGFAIGALVDTVVVTSWINHWRHYDK